MRREDLLRVPVDGYFRAVQARRANRRFIPISIALLLLAAVALLAQAPLLLAAAAAGFALVLLLLSRRKNEPENIHVNLTGAELAIRGGGYDLQLRAPFRFKTGLERRPATDKQDETCFVRMVIDAQGKPLVLEEEVLAGNYPPPLAEIVGESSALGVPDLASLSPFPGTLWALIERLEALSDSTAPSERSGQVKSLFDLGKDQMARREYSEAVATFNAIIRQRPDSARAYFDRGSARYHAREDLDKAVNDLTTALRLDPRQRDAYRIRALTHARLGDWTSMRADCSSALQHEPGKPELFNLRGTACYRLGDYDAALSNFERAVALDATRYESFYNRGLARQRLGLLAEALEDFQQALKLSPSFADARKSSEILRQQLAQRRASSRT